MADNENNSNRSKASDKLKEITEMLEKGIKELFNSDMYKSYLKTMSKFTNYSVNNTLLIAMQKPDATLVAGYNAWQTKFGRHVNRGAKAIKILAPAVYKKKELVEKLDPATQKPVTDLYGNTVMEEVEVKLPYFKTAYVFDVSQTSGKKLPKLCVDELTGSVDGYNKFFEALKAVSPMPIDFINIESGAKGYCNHSTKRIAIQEGMSQVQNVKTAIHEISHAKLHDIDLNAKDTDTSKLKDKQTKEVEAESIAFTVCQHYGIDTSEYSFPYIATWSENKELPELNASLQLIRDTAAEFISQIDEQLQLQEKQRNEQEHTEEEHEESAPIVPVYLESAKYAHDHNESAQWKQSFALNCKCADYIRDNAEQAHNDHKLGSFFNDLIETFGIERTMYVTARTIQARQKDGRFTRAVRDRAEQFQFPDKELKYDNSSRYICEVHSTIMNRIFEKAMQLEETLTELPCEISIEDMHNYGYSYENMLPLDYETARELFENDFPVYVLHPDNSESLITSLDELDEFDGMFGIEKQDWTEASVQRTSVENDMNKEAAFIFGKANGFAIYQLGDGDELRNIRFESLKGIGGVENVDKSNYNMMYSDTVDIDGLDNEDVTYDILKQIYEQFNIDHPDDFKGHSLSVSDVIVLKCNDELAAFYIDSFGFEPIPDFYGSDEKNIEWDKNEKSFYDKQQTLDNEDYELLYEVYADKQRPRQQIDMEDMVISGNATMSRKQTDKQPKAKKQSVYKRLQENKARANAASKKQPNNKKQELEV